MSYLKSSVKGSAARTVTDKAVGKGMLSTVAAAALVKKSNSRGNARKAEK